MTAESASAANRWAAIALLSCTAVYTMYSPMKFTHLMDSWIFRPVLGLSAAAFSFQNAPGSSLISLVIALAVFVAVVAWAEMYFPAASHMTEHNNVRPTKPVSTSSTMRWVLCGHNALMAIISLWLFLALFEHVPDLIRQNGLHSAICHDHTLTREVVAIYWVNFLVKYLEWIDTAFLIALRKDRSFLHVYHHAATAFLCWVQLHGNASVQWVPIMLNLFVHVVMYSYYACCAVGIRIPIKKSITTIQVVQFVIDLIAIYYATFVRWVPTSEPVRPPSLRCNGSLTAAAVGCSILSSYLVLFVQFYRSTYKKRAAASSPGIAEKKNS